MGIKLRKKNGDPFDLTGNTEITLCLQKADKTFTAYTKTGGQLAITGDAVLGKVTVTLVGATETNALQIGPKQDFEIKEEKGAVVTKIKFLQDLLVRASNC